MALTGRIIASIYRIGQNDLKNPAGTPAVQGISHSLPSAQCAFYALPAGTTANGVTMASIIELLPTGLNQPVKKYYTDSSISSLQTNGN